MLDATPAVPVYRTSSLEVAAYLLMQGLTPRVVAVSPTKVAFLFDQSPTLEQHVAGYFAGRAIANLSQYEVCRDYLKAQMKCALEDERARQQSVGGAA